MSGTGDITNGRIVVDQDIFAFIILLMVHDGLHDFDQNKSDDHFKKLLKEHPGILGNSGGGAETRSMAQRNLKTRKSDGRDDRIERVQELQKKKGET